MLKTNDFDYQLPEERIAIKPTEKRSSSRLLVYRKGQIDHASFEQIKDFLPDQSFIVLNDSKVIPARLFFQTPSGVPIEVFLLEPSGTDHATALIAEKSVIWKCLIGNRKRWKTDMEIRHTDTQIGLTAKWHNPEQDLVRLEWDKPMPFGSIVETLGSVPLPPYLKRDSTEEDRIRYQTVYAANPGAVAAPTAGLHFNQELLEDLRFNGHQTTYLTLHVGAGTFLPVKAEDATQHQMHEEKVMIDRTFIEDLIHHQKSIIAVGTTSMRALESMYWSGVQLFHGKDPLSSTIDQHLPYNNLTALPDRKQVCELLLNYLKARHLEQLHLTTSIFIRPGYRFGFCDGLITNFHQPRSTLLMLVCAFIGQDWKRVYDEALSNEYRFLSYGDSSLLIP